MVMVNMHELCRARLQRQSFLLLGIRMVSMRFPLAGHKNGQYARRCWHSGDVGEKGYGKQTDPDKNGRYNGAPEDAKRGMRDGWTKNRRN